MNTSAKPDDGSRPFDAFTLTELETLITSMQYTRLAYENTQYPTYDLRREELDKADRILVKLQSIRGEMKR